LVSKKSFSVNIENDLPYNIGIGEKFKVDDIIGYGFDMFLIDKPNIYLRFLNSQMKDYFNIENQGSFNDVDIKKLNSKSCLKVEFTEKLEIEDKIFEKGAKFCIENTLKRSKQFYYNLFDSENREIVIRLDESEFKRYCKISDYQ